MVRARDGSGFLVDSPHWNRELVGAFEAAGGVDHVLLTHRDDVADAQRDAEHFDAKVWIHRADLDATPFATDILGVDETLIAPGLVGFPVPGHTEGSVLYLHQERHLFSGDTVAWLWRDGDLGAFQDATWFSWSERRRSPGSSPPGTASSACAPGTARGTELHPMR